MSFQNDLNARESKLMETVKLKEKENDDLVNKINEFERSIDVYKQKLVEDKIKFKVTEFFKQFEVSHFFFILERLY